MKVLINQPFISRKTGLEWKQAGMTKERYKHWVETLTNILKRDKKKLRWLQLALIEGKKIKLKLSIFGVSRRIRQLDIHDALAQIIDEVTDCVFPREKGKPIPQTEDRHFWKVEAEKFISDKERVEIEIEELETGIPKSKNIPKNKGKE